MLLTPSAQNTLSTAVAEGPGQIPVLARGAVVVFALLALPGALRCPGVKQKILHSVAMAAHVTSMGDCVPPIPTPSFCDMVSYNITKDVHTPIPDPHNVKELDDIAKDIYFTAIEVAAAVGAACAD